MEELQLPKGLFSNTLYFLNPGDAIVLKKGIWHDACHCVDGETMYFFLSYTNGEPSETTWLSVVPDPVSVDL